MVELATHIGKDSASAADRFLNACEATFEFLVESPQIGAIYPIKSRLSGLRVWRVKGFSSHLTFYTVRQNAIEIVRVVHGARDLDVVLEDE